MKIKTVKELMVPLSEYTTVSEDTTLYEAVKALEETQENFDQTRYRHRAILITDKNNHIVGKVSQLDMIKALEPKYRGIENKKSLSRFGYSQDFLQSIMDQHQLWQETVTDTCKKASKILVKTFMYTPTEGEYIKEGASMDAAVHQLIMGHHHSLLVTRGKEIVGILRLTDVFKETCDLIHECHT
jgi:CBS domain-containing protein